jgi:hypothetical protein
MMPPAIQGEPSQPNQPSFNLPSDSSPEVTVTKEIKKDTRKTRSSSKSKK